MPKKNYTLRLDPEFVKKVDEAAGLEKRSRTNFIETVLSLYLEKTIPSFPSIRKR